MLPINYESWHQMPDSNRNQALKNIKERFALEVSDNYIKKALGKRWRDHKSTLKKEYFKTKITLEEKLRNVPPGILRQFEKMRNCRLVKKLDALNLLTLHIGRKIDLL
ncbi:hypothetical protein Gotur_025489 [Gossypium turneri]